MSSTRASSASSTAAARSGWLTFAGVLLVTVGAFNVINGVAALAEDEYFLVTDDGLLVFDFTAWGWIWLVLGAVQILTALGVFWGQSWARVVGVVLAVLAAIGHAAYLAAYPLWSLIVIGLCVLLIYALVTPQDDARA